MAPPSSPSLLTLPSPLPENRLPSLATRPANYLPPSPPPSSWIEEHEQSLLVRPSDKSIFHQLSHHLHKHRSALHTEYHPICIANVSPTNFEAFLTSHCHDEILKGIDLEYDSLAGQIIMCPPPAPYHDCMPVFLQDVLLRLRNTPFDTPARQRTLSVREIRFRSPSGSYMVPDAAVVVMSRAGDVRVWPTIMVEVANSQGYDNALQKARRWFVQSEGMVEVVLVLKFTAKDPLLDPACYLEAWRYAEVVADDTSDGDGDSDEPMDVDSDFSGGASTDDNVEDVVDPAEEQTAPGEDTDPGTTSTDPAVLANEESDSSLSSLSSDSSDVSDQADTVAHDQSQDSVSTALPSSSSSSSNSTGKYDPHPVHDIILSGARKTVLPVAHPADPEMRYLALHYSDYFGSENVPPGRDPAEEVLLDLDELREEITMLIRMTAKQEEQVAKRQADAAEADPGSKMVRR